MQARKSEQRSSGPVSINLHSEAQMHRHSGSVSLWHTEPYPCYGNALRCERTGRATTRLIRRRRAFHPGQQATGTPQNTGERRDYLITGCAAEGRITERVIPGQRTIYNRTSFSLESRNSSTSGTNRAQRGNEFIFGHSASRTSTPPPSSLHRKSVHLFSSPSTHTPATSRHQLS